MIDIHHLAHVRPSRRQYTWQQLGFSGFIHFGMNTMTGREWGTGDEDPTLFDPPEVDADAWVKLLKSAGMRAVILTAKHHDGFCLWPTVWTAHSVAASPWRGGRGDLVREVAEACARHDMGLGIYLSPWDKNAPSYGQGKAYDDMFVGQLVELLTGYGDITEVWFDGANGEGPNGKRQEYDWERYYRTVRALQPEAVIAVCGPDVRWCGNEAGHTRPEEWSVVPRSLQDAERVAARSQQSDDGEFSRQVGSDEQDLGSRTALATTAAGLEDSLVGELVWYPAEVNTSIRPGWFHHPEEDELVRSAAELFAIYRSAVGGNSTFLLNVPPTRQGRIAEPDRQALEGLGRLLAQWNDAALPARVTFSSRAESAPATDTLARAVTDPRDDIGWWSPATGDAAPWAELDLDATEHVGAVVIKEQITMGQRIEGVRILVEDGSSWREVATTGAIGYQRIVEIPPMTTSRLRIEITAARWTPAVAAIVPIAARALPAG